MLLYYTKNSVAWVRKRTIHKRELKDTKLFAQETKSSTWREISTYLTEQILIAFTKNRFEFHKQNINLE
jgi:hypothetical protein